ncbi:Pheromone B alpha 3 receptor [Schizophyllum commune H4-8] [Rhizoctonia solani]|uniref:Pheromone B alpha 3 receptor [Schizophyllum commune H4-8] n=1 Tax=Rhizoctonia solani TaxID=456999 RepID=A0A0K6FYD0_9AGAM|nr:Pheromone B alpha 3 receptor [Schizophyllum commune H4-8] [Rhizoctonia solani]
MLSAVKIVIGQSIGITAASMCINRKLYNIATIQSVSITPESKRRNMIIDLCVGVLFPIIVMALHYIVQQSRYAIIENIGCWPATENSLVSIPLVYMWPLFICCTSFIYCVLSIYGFLKARQQFNQVLSNSGSGITLSRYFRLLALASEEILFGVPFAAYILKANLSQGSIPPWVSFDYLHREYNTIYPTPWESLKLDPRGFNVVLAPVTPGSMMNVVDEYVVSEIWGIYMRVVRYQQEWGIWPGVRGWGSGAPRREQTRPPKAEGEEATASHVARLLAKEVGQALALLIWSVRGSPLELSLSDAMQRGAAKSARLASGIVGVLVALRGHLIVIFNQIMSLYYATWSMDKKNIIAYTYPRIRAYIKAIVNRDIRGYDRSYTRYQGEVTRES